ncbi:hypothetical protein V3851_08195 [Paenibacillus sp. M1]|uniref:Uncharacterized protein n=1 Tax=Paenibacillus haidiansis TaxID=1574488 RepID=A0ABU7VRH2_9BACL
MFESKRHIRIDAEEWVEDPEDGQVDVVVTFPDATKWISNFYTPKCIESMRRDYALKGHCLNGAYWCASSPVIIVDRITRGRIEQVIDELIAKGEFRYVFEYFGSVDDRDFQRSDYPEDFFDSTSQIDPSFVTYHANLLMQMLDQSGEDVRESVLQDILDYYQRKNNLGGVK